MSILADPTRRAILGRLAEGEVTVGELAEPFDISLPGHFPHCKQFNTPSDALRTAEFYTAGINK